MSKANSVLVYEGAKGHHTVVPKHCGPLPPLPPYSAFRSERFMSEADSVLAYEGAKGHHTVAEEEETAATDASLRLMRLLADEVVTRLIAASPGFPK